MFCQTDKALKKIERRKILGFWLIILVIFVDQVSKFFVCSALNRAPQQSIPIIKNFFYLTLVQNKGTAFGLFKNQSFFFLLISLMAIILISYFLFFKKEEDGFLKIPLCLILGGATGNVIDRLRFGFVTDFLDFRVWPVFNFADFFICVGAGLLMLQVAGFNLHAKKLKK